MSVKQAVRSLIVAGKTVLPDALEVLSQSNAPLDLAKKFMKIYPDKYEVDSVLLKKINDGSVHIAESLDARISQKLQSQSSQSDNEINREEIKEMRTWLKAELY